MNDVAWMIIVVVCCVLGVIVGHKIGKKTNEKNSSGNLVIDTSDTDGYYMFLELSEPIDRLMDSEEVTFSVDVKSYISHE